RRNQAFITEFRFTNKVCPVPKLAQLGDAGTEDPKGSCTDPRVLGKSHPRGSMCGAECIPHPSQRETGSLTGEDVTGKFEKKRELKYKQYGSYVMPKTT
ncbi:hypothetical protein NPIL_575901, partial [Nephila pilipes]